MLGTAFLMVAFGFPETKWHRVHPNELVRKDTNLSSPLSEYGTTVDLGKCTDLAKLHTHDGLPDLSHTTTSHRDRFLGTGTPSRRQFDLFQPNSHPFKSILMDLWIPCKLFAFPIVEFASFVVSFSASSYLTINLTQSEAFAAPPYKFSPTTIGFCNFASLIGALIGLLTAGPLSDWVSMRLTRMNRGIREPEMRLPTMIPYVLIMMVGNFVVAFGYQQHWDWKVSQTKV